MPPCRATETLLNGTRRHGLTITLAVPDSVWQRVRDTVDLDSSYAQYFAHQETNLDTQSINWRSNYYFYAIPRDPHILRNSRLAQTMGWPEGTFDPLQ